MFFVIENVDNYTQLYVNIILNQFDPDKFLNQRDVVFLQSRNYTAPILVKPMCNDFALL